MRHAQNYCCYCHTYAEFGSDEGHNRIKHAGVDIVYEMGSAEPDMGFLFFSYHSNNIKVETSLKIN